MAPGKKLTSSFRRSSTPSSSQLSPIETIASSQPHDLPPSQNPALFQPNGISPSQTSAPSQEQDVPSSHNSTPTIDPLGDASSLVRCNGSGIKRVRGKTVGKGIEKLIAQNGGEKLLVLVLDEWKSLCGIMAPKAAMLLGVYIRRMSPVKDTPTWFSVDKATQSAIIQSVLDKFRISDDYHANQVAQQAVHLKCYHMHLNWRYKMKRHYKKMKEQHVDVYSRPYENITLEDWRHLIDDVWKNENHKKRSKNAKKNRALLQHSHCSGSRSFVAAMTIPVENDGCENYDFPELYEKTHKKKDKEWIHPMCAEKHTQMVRMREESNQLGVQLTPEEMSREVLGKRKRYILGLGAGPQPSSSSSVSCAASRALDDELLKLKAEMEKIQMERDDERRTREVEIERMQMEREEERREREQERREREVEQKKIEDLTHLVSQLIQEKTHLLGSSV